MEVLVVMTAIYTFVSGENSFRAMVGLERDEYIKLVKETLRFVLSPAFVEREANRQNQKS
jgi:TetR/AcrR family transcriptional regulator, regulator of cefoperazone and chloramphenicol sensitivity